jgi:hypothetical protein
MAGETLTIEFRAEALIQYRVALEPDGHRLREVADPTPLPHGHPSPQPFLVPLDETTWRPARKLAPYRPRRKRKWEIPQSRSLSTMPRPPLVESPASGTAARRNGCHGAVWADGLRVNLGRRKEAPG